MIYTEQSMVVTGLTITSVEGVGAEDIAIEIPEIAESGRVGMDAAYCSLICR